MPTLELTPEQEQHAQVLAEQALQAAKDEILQMARLLASKDDGQVLGATEFQLRGLVHKIAADMLRTEIQHRQKKVTRAPAPTAPTASTRPSSRTSIDPNRS